MLADIDQSALDDAVATLRADGVDAHGVVCDVRKLDDVNHLADEAFRVFGDVHVVFNNAGIAYAGPIEQTSHDDWRFVIDVDLWGPVHGVEAFLPRLMAQGEGSHMVFTSSFAGLIPNVGLGPYCVAKYGVVALAETLAFRVSGIAYDFAGNPMADASVDLSLEMLKRSVGFKTVKGEGQVPAYAEYLAGELKAHGFADDDVKITPQTRPPTMIGAPATLSNPTRRASAASGPSKLA